MLEYSIKLKSLNLDALLAASLYLNSHALMQKAELVRAKTSINEFLDIARQEKKGYRYCDGFELFAVWSAKSHKYEACVRIMGARKKIRETTYITEIPIQVRLYEKCIAESRGGLGEEAFNQAWEAGRAMTVEEALKYALELTNE